MGSVLQLLGGLFTVAVGIRIITRVRAGVPTRMANERRSPGAHLDRSPMEFSPRTLGIVLGGAVVLMGGAIIALAAIQF